MNVRRTWDERRVSIRRNWGKHEMCEVNMRKVWEKREKDEVSIRWEEGEVKVRNWSWNTAPPLSLEVSLHSTSHSQLKKQLMKRRRRSAQLANELHAVCNIYCHWCEWFSANHPHLLQSSNDYINTNHSFRPLSLSQRLRIRSGWSRPCRASSRHTNAF